MPDDAIERVRRAVDDATGGRFKTLGDFTEALLSEEDSVAQDALIGEAATLLHHFAASASQQAPEGWRLMPVEPSLPMILAGQKVGGLGAHSRFLKKLYRAMLDAAPSVTLGEVG